MTSNSLAQVSVISMGVHGECDQRLRPEPPAPPPGPGRGGGGQQQQQSEQQVPPAGGQSMARRGRGGRKVTGEERGQRGYR